MLPRAFGEILKDIFFDADELVTLRFEIYHDVAPIGADRIAQLDEKSRLSGSFTADDEVYFAAQRALELVDVEVIEGQRCHFILCARIADAKRLQQRHAVDAGGLDLTSVLNDAGTELRNVIVNVGELVPSLGVVANVQWGVIPGWDKNKLGLSHAVRKASDKHATDVVDDGALNSGSLEGDEHPRRNCHLADSICG